MGTPIEVKATAKTGAEGSVMYDFGDNAAEAIEMFGDGPVHSYFVAHGKVVLQAAIRRSLEAGQPVEGLADSFKPGVTMQRVVDPLAAAKAKYATMSDDERKAFLESLRESAE